MNNSPQLNGQATDESGVMSTALVLTLGLAGCNGGEDTTAPPAVHDEALVLSDYDRLLLLDAQDADALAQTIDAFTQTCLKERGYSGPFHDANPLPSGTIINSLDREDIEFRHFYVSSERAAREGMVPSFSRREQFFGAGSPVYNQAMYGSGDERKPEAGSCFDQLGQRFAPHLGESRDLELQIQQLLESVGESVVGVNQEATRSWAECMAEHGLDRYKKPEELFSPAGGADVNQSWPEDAPKADEIEVATTSGECMITTGYLEKVSRAHAEATNSILAKHPGVFTRWKELRQDMIDRIEKG